MSWLNLTLEAKAITQTANEYDSDGRLFIWKLLVFLRIRKSEHYNSQPIGNYKCSTLQSRSNPDTSPKQLANAVGVSKDQKNGALIL